MRLLFAILVTSVISGYSQKVPIKLGDIPMEDMKMAVYDLDSSAVAVVLADFGDSKITYSTSTGFNLTFERIRRIKILKKEGYKWADFEIPLYGANGKNEDYSALKAYTYNLEGGKIVETKMKSDAVFKEQTNENWRLIKFTLPNVKEGSIIEFTYKVSSPYWINFQDWEFQSSIPTRMSEYRTKIPEYFSYQRYMQGYVPIDINENSIEPKSITIVGSEQSDRLGRNSALSDNKIDYIENQNRWVAKNVPSFKEEPFITSTKDYISKINFELASIQMPNKPFEPVMGTWEQINKQLLEADNFGLVVKQSNFLTKKVEELTAGMTDPSQKIGVIYRYVKENVIWDGLMRKYTDGNFKKVLDEKKGNSAEINLLLTSMLQKADLPADPVLISTRANGSVRQQIPISSQFNYVLCSVTVEEKTMLLDATDRSLPITILPERCLNGTGFIISKNGYRWINLYPNFKSKSNTSLDLVINEDGILKGKIVISSDGYDAQRVRNEYASKGEAGYLKSLTDTYAWQLQKSQFENINSISNAVKETHEVVLENHVQSSGGIIYLNPILRDRIEENPFKLEKREYPVDFKSPFERLITGKISLPEGYTLDDPPKPKIVSLPNNGGRYTYSLTQIGSNISITSLLTINKSLFTQEEYDTLKEFYNQVVAKQAEQIVIKKK